MVLECVRYGVSVIFMLLCGLSHTKWIRSQSMIRGSMLMKAQLMMNERD
jgi:hypothetical protein